MRRSRWARSIFATIFFLGATCAALVASAEPPDAKSTSTPSNGDEIKGAAELIRSALRLEAEGDADYRRLLLTMAMNEHPNVPAVRWQNGYVRDGDVWRTPAEVAAARAGDERLRDYFERRKQAKDRPDHQLVLGRWCLHNGLPDRAPYHLARVFALRSTAAQRSEAAKLLSFKQIGKEGASGLLMSEAKSNRIATQFKQMQASWRKWAPILERIATEMANTDEGKRQTALAELAQIDDPGAVPGLELLVSKQSDEHALAVVDVLAQIPEHDATMSLARHAIFAPSKKVRAAAAAQLARRPIEDYAPWLLSSLISPVKSQYWIAGLPDGHFRYLHNFYREDADRIYTLHQDVSLMGWPNLRHSALSLNALVGEVDPQLTLMSEAAKVQDRVLQQNVQAEFINKRVDAVLALATGKTMNADPVRWWNWWQQYNEVQTPDQKPVVASYSRTSLAYMGGGTWGYSPDCFPAGTEVLTETGPRWIQTIQGGDRVLAQDVDTGELAFKTVLSTARRPATPIISIGLSDGKSLQTTKGHQFWVSGSGWKMAKFLKLGDRLHCLDGFVTIESVVDAEPRIAFNLIVEDFSSYFVGDQRLLVHDNKLRTPTLAIVPGLVEE